MARAGQSESRLFPLRRAIQLNCSTRTRLHPSSATRSGRGRGPPKPCTIKWEQACELFRQAYDCTIEQFCRCQKITPPLEVRHDLLRHAKIHALRQIPGIPTVRSGRGRCLALATWRRLRVPRRCGVAAARDDRELQPGDREGHLARRGLLHSMLLLAAAARRGRPHEPAHGRVLGPHLEEGQLAGGATLRLLQHGQDVWHGSPPQAPALE